MNSETDLLARAAIEKLLTGAAPNGTQPAELGSFSELYDEMVLAWRGGGTEAARRIFASYAKHDARVAALRAGEPEAAARRKWSAAELLRAEFPPPVWLVENLLPVGLVVLAGRPKLGKSWLALQMATAVAAGGRVFNRSITQKRVLYMALEDNARRLQDRLKKQRASAAASIDFRFEWEPFAGKGIGDLAEELEREQYALVVVDTISRALGKADQMDLVDMNLVLGQLQRLAIGREMSLLLVDHHRKAASGVGDVIDDVMGSSGKAAVADAAMGLYRQRGEQTATLKVTGRDVDDQELAVRFDRELFCWQMEGLAGDVKSGTLQEAIVAAIVELGGKASTKQIADYLRRLPQNVSRELQELLVKGAIVRDSRAGREVRYRLDDDAEPG